MADTRDSFNVRSAIAKSKANIQRFFKFIFLARSWASDRANLTKALKNLSKDAKGTKSTSTSGKEGESTSLLNQSSSSGMRKSTGRSPLWLFIFPEGTITSDEERAKSKRYADKEGIVRVLSSSSFPCFSTSLHQSILSKRDQIKVSPNPVLPCVIGSDFSSAYRQSTCKELIPRTTSKLPSTPAQPVYYSF